MTTLTGTRGKPIGALHSPPTAAVGAGPWRLISAADVHGPRLPASVKAVSRTYRQGTLLKTAIFRDLPSAQVPVATGVPQFIPFMLTEIEYWPIFPLDDVSCRGR